MKNKMKCIICWSLVPIFLLIALACFQISHIPNTIFIRDNQKTSSDYIINMARNNSKLNSIKFIDGKKMNLNLLGVLPVKSVDVKKVPETYVYPGGTPIGVRLTTKGVLVVSLSDVKCSSGKIISPAAESGIQVGDMIININDTPINSSEDLIKQIRLNKNNKLKVKIERKGKVLTKVITPVKEDTKNAYKIGLWVRDSTSGVGTLTFYDSKSNKFAALGHPITDVDTGNVLKINKGEIVESSIISVRKGQKGNPGELRGIFINENSTLGSVYKNTFCGIYGKSNVNLSTPKYDKPIKIALRNEINEGPAKILTTIDGNEPKLYDIKIEKLLPQESPGPKSMVIKVTDKELLEKTGGIVQGMSGSPIIQDNKLVGAVTHVLINRPDVGYGIYIEWMLKDAEMLQNN
ncbi:MULTISPECIES: SpoIVB peptidase [Clostridium]|uniref:SpoIVB peptidase n=1 Tax=Clostridium TaxID=1485 RepID=UPI0004D4CDA7|nr:MULTISPECIES: SpoIVB peptidase [Clostridium]KEH88535.1 stage IV sporulation protein B [Clostridium novyi A str. BKT29909]KEH88989.1 stage IV sporulation protein B [Clostridium novyi A str. 4540]KEH92787.1 stage IV sporulation protein B [Clostridium botulinum C/D str. It1]KEH93394.1 stage IV sporulation protein B [Clostridium novyi A str. GD211209]